MEKPKKFLLLIALITKIPLTGQVINTFAGNGVSGYSGDGGLATAATLKVPCGVAIDKVGNVFIADFSNNRIRKISPTGIISTIAGTGVGSYSGDGGLATGATISHPEDVAVDTTGNIYIADTWNSVIRKIDVNGIISTVAGIGGSLGYGGDGGPATSGVLYEPFGVSVAKNGEIYIADTYNNRIRKVNISGLISTVAGNGTQGYSGDGAAATGAKMHFPNDIVLDTNNNLYIADGANNVIRKVDNIGIISTVAGTGTSGFSGDGAAAINAQLNGPYGLCLDNSGNIYVADTQNNRIRKINVLGNISTIAGTGAAGYSGDGGNPILAKLNAPWKVESDNTGNLYIVDSNNQRIRVVNTNIGIKQNATNESIVIFPNPSSSNIHITSQEIIGHVSMQDGHGNEVYAGSSSEKEFNIDFNVQSGIYYLSFFYKGMYEIKKIVVRK